MGAACAKRQLSGVGAEAIWLSDRHLQPPSLNRVPVKCLREKRFLMCLSEAMRQNCNDVDSMLALAEAIRADRDINDVVHIGISGSGSELALQTLKPFMSATQHICLESNFDGHDLADALEPCDPAHPLFNVVSKSWSMAETLQNLESAMDWLHAAGHNPKHKFIAITADGFNRVLAGDIQNRLHTRQTSGSTAGLLNAILQVGLGVSSCRDSPMPPLA